MCTIFDCAQDSDCAGGWSCATVDVAPNVTAAKRSFGQTRTVCLPRRYCSSCRLDHDCSSAPDGTQQHCIQDANGSGFCSPQCATDSNCPLDATCNAMPWGVCAQVSCRVDGDCQATAELDSCSRGVCRKKCGLDVDCPASNGTRQHCAAGTCAPPSCASDDDCPPVRGTFRHCNAGACTPECGSDADCNPAVGDQICVSFATCMPRAGVCRGDGNFCSPCGSDADCVGGYCLTAPYSGERFCSQAMKTGTKCSMTPAPGSCPMRPSGANYKGVSCTPASDSFSPADQCIGEVSFGSSMGRTQYVPGCWTVNR